MTLSAQSRAILDNAERDVASIGDAADAFDRSLRASVHGVPDPRNPFVPIAPSDPRELVKWNFLHQQWQPFAADWMKFRSGVHELVGAIATDTDAARLANALKGYRARLSELLGSYTKLHADHDLGGSAGTGGRGASSVDISPAPRRAATRAAALDPATERRAYQEADARFWAQTGYKPGQKLDAKDPLDRKMIPTYTDIFNKIKQEITSGRIAWTFEHPEVKQAIGDASIASAAAVVNLDRAASAARAGDHESARGELAAAAAAHASAKAATLAAARYQPPTVSTRHVEHAAREIMHFTMHGGRGDRDPGEWTGEWDRRGGGRRWPITGTGYGGATFVISGPNVGAAMQAAGAPSNAEAVSGPAASDPTPAGEPADQAQDVVDQSTGRAVRVSGKVIAIAATLAAGGLFAATQLSKSKGRGRFGHP